MFRAAVLLLCLLWAPACFAANVSISLDANKDTSVPDPAYPFTGSTITSTLDNQSNITVTVAGRNYGTLPLVGARWGLKHQALPWQPNKQGFVVTGGFQPSAMGSRLTPLGAQASYISFSLSGIQPATQFQNFSIELSGLEFATTTNAWGAASPGGFGNWAAAVLSNNGKKLTLNVPDFLWLTTGPVEFRLYGVTALTDGAFTDIKLSGSVTVVPEPKSVFLLACAIPFVFRRRRNRLR